MPSTPDASRRARRPLTSSHRVRLPLAAAAVAVLAGASAPPASAADTPSLEEILQADADALLAQGAPGVLVELDTAGDDVEVRSGYGDVAAKTPVPWDASFRIGSMTKPVVATTVLQLVGEGRLSLDDTVERWLPGVVQGNGNDGTQITVRQLLQHTSGLVNYVGDLPLALEQEAFERDRFTTVTAEQAVALAVAHEPDFAPGTAWNYSNTGYALAGMIIEAVTGNTWQQEVHHRIIGPLDLEDTHTPGALPDIPGPNAVGYERFPGPGATAEDPRYGEAIDATLLNPSWGGAAGEIISTTDDGNRFLQALLGGELLRPVELAEMTRTVPTGEELEGYFPGAAYGLGLMRIDNACGGYWSHGGDIMGFMTRNGVTPDGTRSVVVSINTDSMVPEPDAPVPTGAATNTLVDHALCGTD